ncbi:MAG: VCBS repeat-containing protein, partial [Planctomycetaceae bacterium]|nr:VCBS repeat-containing protein [Planctomycetaceae bacterium]
GDNDFDTVHSWQQNGVYEGDNARAVQAIDLDGDGDLDMVSASYTSARLTVRLNQGDGTFGEATYYASLDTAEGGLAAADFDGDGLLDVVVSGERGTGKISLHLSNGDGTLAPAYEYQFTSTGGRPRSIVAADLTGDDIPDVAVVDQHQSKMVVLQYVRSTGVFQHRSTEFFSEQPGELAAVDVDGDDDLDLVAGVVNDGNSSNIAFRVYANDGTGGFDLISTIHNLYFPNSLTFGDVDNDGDQDFVTNVVDGDRLTYVYANDGSGNFSVAQTLPLESDTQHNAIELTDINADGWLDLIVVQGETSQMTIYANQQGVFQSYADLSIGLLPVTLKSADLDGDGDIDHLVGHKASDSFHNGSDNFYVMENLWEEANRTTTMQFTVTVTPINDSPIIDPITDLTIDEDASEQTVDLTGVMAGGGESQNLRVTATS